MISQWSDQSIDWRTVAAWTIENHISAIHDKWDTELFRSDKQRIGELLKSIGYRPLFARLVMRRDTLEITIRNRGNAPCYLDRRLQLTIDGQEIANEVNLKGLLPGDHVFKITSDKLTGARQITLGFVDSQGNADIQLAQPNTPQNLLTVDLTRPSRAVAKSVAGVSDPDAPPIKTRPHRGRLQMAT